MLLKRFGQMAEDFKSFVNQLRSNGSDIIFICHDKETVEGGYCPSTLLIVQDRVRICFFALLTKLGYISKVNGKRTVSFEPTDTFIGKNVAQLQMMEIPESTSADFSNCMAGNYFYCEVPRYRTNRRNRRKPMRCLLCLERI